MWSNKPRSESGTFRCLLVVSRLDGLGGTVHLVWDESANSLHCFDLFNGQGSFATDGSGPSPVTPIVPRLSE